jgi:hypothetical protein
MLARFNGEFSSSIAFSQEIAMLECRELGLYRNKLLVLEPRKWAWLVSRSQGSIGALASQQGERR